MDFPPFSPPFLLRNAHAQTIWSPALHRGAWLKGQLRLIPTPDADAIRVHAFATSDERPRGHVLILHGLEGSVESVSIQLIVHRLVQTGLQCHVLEFRGCGRGGLNQAPRLYHSGETSDPRLVLDRIVTEAGGAPIFAVGLSMGANVLGRLLAEFGTSAPLRAACLISTPFILSRAADAVDNSLGGFYQRIFLRTLLPKARAKALQHPGCLDLEKIQSIRSIRAYDEHVTAPLHGFAGAEDYYTRCSCHSMLGAVGIPTLLLSAQDDPLVPLDTFPHGPISGNHKLVPLLTAKGGHLGFIGSDWRPWHPRIIANFLLKHV